MKLTGKIHLLRIDFDIIAGQGKIIPRFVNVIIVFGENITLIDTGVKGSEAIISDYIKNNGRKLSEIDTIILSHSHPDHIGSASVIRATAGCKVFAHKSEVNWMSDLELQYRERPVPGFFNLVDEPVVPDGFIDDGHVIRADDNVTLEIIHSPGHSPGSLNIFFREDRILFTADSVPVVNDIPNYQSAGQLLKSLERIKTRKGYDMLITSWTPPLQTKEEIMGTISDGEKYIKRIEALVKSIYNGREPRPLSFCAEAIKALGLPHFLATTVVDQALRSHLADVQ